MESGTFTFKKMGPAELRSGCFWGKSLGLCSGFHYGKYQAKILTGISTYLGFSWNQHSNLCMLSRKTRRLLFKHWGRKKNVMSHCKTFIKTTLQIFHYKKKAQPTFFFKWPFQGSVGNWIFRRLNIQYKIESRYVAYGKICPFSRPKTGYQHLRYSSYWMALVRHGIKKIGNTIPPI